MHHITQILRYQRNANMKQSRLLLVWSCIWLIFPGCEEILHPVACDIEDPEKNISWLAEMIEAAEAEPGNLVRITLFMYEDQEVFYVEQSPAIADKMDVVYTCEGETLCQFGGIAGFNTCPDFEETANKVRIIWIE